MSQQTTGRAALVASNLPTLKSVTGATNATPIVVTTSVPHLLQTNEIIVISGVGGNTAANGTFVASVLSGTTVALLAYPAGASVAGTGAYTSGGSLVSAGYGVTVPVPNDLTDSEQAATVNVPFEALLDRAAWLSYQAGYYLPTTKVDRAGDTMTGQLSVSNGTGGTSLSTTGSINIGGAGSNAASVTTNGSVITAGDVVLGNAAEVLSVTGATNATPIVVTTSVPHGLPDGSQVIIASVGGNTAANGTFVASVLSGTTVALIGSAGSGSYTSGGSLTKRGQVVYSSLRTETVVLTSRWDSSASSTSGTRYWIDDFGTIFSAWKNVQSDPTTQSMWIGWEIGSEVPRGAIITSATMYFNPPTGHGAVPATPPTVTVGKVVLATGTSTSMASVADPNTGSVGVYEVYTGLTATLSTGEYVDKSRCRYFVYLQTETGTNALSGLRVYGASVTITTTSNSQR